MGRMLGVTPGRSGGSTSSTRRGTRHGVENDLPGLAACFERYVAAEPEAPALYCDRLDGEPLELTRAELGALALRHGAALVRRGVKPGDRVVLAVPTSVEFVATFWGTLLIGAIAVPVPAPDKRGLAEARLAQLERICAVALPAVIVASPDALGVDSVGGVAVLDPEELEAGRDEAVPVASAPDALAVIQFTSGSTGSPRGCALSHRAVAYNAWAVVRRLGIAPGDTTVCWLPLYHDMGLVSGLAVPVLAGGPVRLRQPTRFLANPLVWMRDLAAYPRTHTAAPNFAMALVLQRLERRPPDDLDLSGVGNIVCGAEPIDPLLARRFVDALKAHGLPETALHPAYGMAEATLMATSSAGGLRTRTFDRAKLHGDGLGVAGGVDTTTLVNLGTPIEGGAVRILSGGRELPDGAVGDIEIRLPSLMTGYFRDDAATEAAFEDGWLRTGDLGFLSGGELFVTGRRKDIVIVAGRNIAPADVEYAAAHAARIDPTRIGAFGHPGPLGTEDLHIVVETRPSADQAALRALVSDACYATCGVFPASVILVRSGGVPRTTSGKVQRARLRQMMAAGELTDLGAADLAA